MEHSPEIEEKLNVGLPKWPQMIVVGQSVTEEQASEIIRRTDSFFVHGYGGNNRDFERAVRTITGMPPDFFDRMDEDKERPGAFAEIIEQERAWRERWGCIETSYVSNAWIASAFVYGPHGWCHPDGTILHLDNVGKWPSASSIYEDWLTLVGEFPFLDLSVVLYDGEQGEEEEEKTAVIGFRVKNGAVEIITDDPETALWEHTTPVKLAQKHGQMRNESAMMMRVLNPNGRAENAIDINQIHDWVKKVEVENA